MWLQFDWGEGPRIGTRRTCLFCAWLAWSRFRVVIPTWDQTLGTLVSCVDATLRRLAGAPTYLLTDNPKTVTVEHIAGVPVRHPEIVAAGRHYGATVHSCEPFDPESKGGVEATVKIAKADLVPRDTNLVAAYGSFAELAVACEAWCERVNARVHRETGAAPREIGGGEGRERTFRAVHLARRRQALAVGEGHARWMAGALLQTHDDLV